MFTPLGCFADIPCPRDKECTLLKCLFLHSNETSEKGAQNPIPTDTAHPAKRLKMDTKIESSSGSQKQSLDPGRMTTPLVPKQSAASQGPSKAQSPIRGMEKASKSSSAETFKSCESEPVKLNGTPQATQLPPRQTPKESLNPRLIRSAPATHTNRTAILKKLHGCMATLNEKLRKNNDRSNQCFVLTPDELITMALDEEEKCGRENPAVYSNVIKLRIVKLTKMNIEDWIKEVMAHLNRRYYKINPIKNPSSDPQSIETDLTPAEEKVVVLKLVKSLSGLEEYGYITTAPTKADIEVAQKGVDGSMGWEKCDRCGQRFQVFPGRREDGTLTTGGQCTYHSGRPVHPRVKKTDRVTGSAQPYFPCCNESIGTSSGCTKADTHVFKVSEAKRLASILQFKTTPTQAEKGPLEPVSIDCEMGYTTLGLELIRLTAVSWPEGRNLLDVLVRPTGEILDLNTRFSGVTSQDYASAKPYNPSTSSPDMTDENGKTKPPLPVVQSLVEARELLLSLLQPETPLIGHAIDNDLNACRIIHPTVIDTVLLFPHPKGLPIRHSLKVLAQRHLGRNIQTGDHGHDSKEDSVTTGDLVRVKTGIKWKALQDEGWKIENNQLVHPNC